MPATVLVVDDAPDTRMLIAAVLESEGYRVIVAGDGGTALAETQQTLPDLILLDACMPVMDGFELCKRLKADHRLTDRPVIFMTGLTASEDIVRGFRVGGADYVTKPIKPDALLARLEAHLQRALDRRQADAALNVGGHATLIVDDRGVTQWQSSHAETILQRYFDAGATASLPDALARWLASPERVLRPYKVFCGEFQLSVRFAGYASDGGRILTLVEHHDACLIADFAERFSLTPRQAEVLLWISRGKTNPDIAAILDMKPRTVDKHIEHIFPQLGVETRAAAAAIALDAIGGA